MCVFEFAARPFWIGEDLVGQFKSKTNTDKDTKDRHNNDQVSLCHVVQVVGTLEARVESMEGQKKKKTMMR